MDHTDRIDQAPDRRELKSAEDQNPTILSRLILNRKYDSALRRLKGHRGEAAIWIVSKRGPYEAAILEASKRGTYEGMGMENTGEMNASPHRSLQKRIDPKLLDYSIRQLPLHIACGNLASSESDKEELELLIANLIVAYPEACSQHDHEGKIPLHDAISNNASAETISVFLMACPETLHERDKFGRSPTDLNRLSSRENKEQIQNLLMRGTEFWVQRGHETLDLSGHQSRTDNAEAHSALTPIVEESTSFMSSRSPTTRRSSTFTDPVQRAAHLEKLLAEMYEKNYEQGAMVEELMGQKLALEDEVSQLKQRLGSTSGASREGAVRALEEENRRLKEELVRLREDGVHRRAAGSDDNSDGSNARMFLEHRNAKLKFENDRLTEKNMEYQARIDHLEIAVKALRRKTQAESNTSSKGSERGDSKYFDQLLESLQADAPYATERYLSGKVLDLEEQLGDAAVSSAHEFASSIEENKRLMTENKVLHSRVKSLERRMRASSDGSIHRRERQVSSSSIGSFNSDDLHEIFHQAEAMYSSDGSRMSLDRRGSGGGNVAMALSEPDQPRKVKSITSDSADEEIPIPADMLEAIQTAIFNIPQSDTESLLVNAEKLYGKQIPSDIKNEIRRLNPDEDLDAKVSGSSEDDDLDTVLQEATNLSGKGLSRSLIRAWKRAAIVLTRDTLMSPSEASGKDDMDVDVVDALQTATYSGRGGNIETILEDAEAVHGKPMPQELKSYVRHVSLAPEKARHDAADPDDLDSVLQEAERLYGKKLSPELIEAWRKISLGPRAGPDESFGGEPQASDDIHGGSFRRIEPARELPDPLANSRLDRDDRGAGLEANKGGSTRTSVDARHFAQYHDSLDDLFKEAMNSGL